MITTLLITQTNQQQTLLMVQVQLQITIHLLLKVLNTTTKNDLQIMHLNSQWLNQQVMQTMMVKLLMQEQTFLHEHNLKCLATPLIQLQLVQ